MGIKLLDMILIVSILTCVLCLWMLDFTGAGIPSAVRIYNGRGLFKEISLQQDARVSVKGSLGESVIEVHSGEVLMAYSPCANKLCVHTGKISRSGECIVCLPNKVSAVISSRDTDMDALSY